MADRRRPRILHALALLLGLLLALQSAGCSRLTTNRKSDPVSQPAKVTRLPNGLTVSIHPERSLPLVTLDMWVRVGSGDEPPEIAGISHFLEHMLFKRTERLAVGEYDRRIEGLGGYLNAATSTDYTHYYVSFPAEHFARVLEDFADVLQNSTLDPAEVERERQVILEEVRLRQDQPFTCLYDLALSSMIRSGAYKHPVIGYEETVRAITRDNLLEHYRRFYTGDRLYLSVTGDVDIATAREAIDRAFGGLQPASRPWLDKPAPIVSAPPARADYARDWKECYFILGYPGPAGDDLDALAAADVAEYLLTGGRSSRLVRLLVEKKSLASSVSASFPSRRLPSPIMIFGTCEESKLEATRTELLAEIRRILDDGVTDEEFQRARRQALNGHLFSLETNAGRAQTIGYSHILLGNAHLLERYDDALSALKKSDVERFLRRHLDDRQASFFHSVRPAAGTGGG